MLRLLIKRELYVSSRYYLPCPIALIGCVANISCGAVFENTESGPFSVDYVISHDDGMSWGERGRLYTARSGKLAGAPQVYNVWGTLVASFMTNEDIDGTNGSTARR